MLRYTPRFALRSVTASACAAAAAAAASSSCLTLVAASQAAPLCFAAVPVAARRLCSTGVETRTRLHEQTLSELQGEETQAHEPEPATPPGWALAHDLGSNFFTATKKVGDETLDLYCPLRSPRATAAEREAGREDGAAAQPFSVLISRKGRGDSLFASLSVLSGELVVEQIQMIDGTAAMSAAELRELHRGTSAKITQSYEGPGIFELEEPFADPLFAFLEDRGLTDEFGEFVALYAYHTEQREYINWLQKLSSFTK